MCNTPKRRDVQSPEPTCVATSQVGIPLDAHPLDRARASCRLKVTNPQPTWLSPEEYLARELESLVKHEYVSGYVFAMAGASKAHVILVGNLVTLLRSHLRGSGCDVYASDMKLRVEKRNCFYYPDLMVSCDDRDRTGDPYFIQFPKLVIEVYFRLRRKPSIEATNLLTTDNWKA